MPLDSMEIAPVTEIQGCIRPPGSKSIANRALLLAGLAKGKTQLSYMPQGLDVHQMLDALALLGVDIRHESEQCTVRGQGRAFASQEPLNLFLGNAGTAMRPLCAAGGEGIHEPGSTYGRASDSSFSGDIALPVLRFILKTTVTHRYSFKAGFMGRVAEMR